MWNLLALGVLAAGAADVNISLLRGDPVAGALVRLSEREVVIATADGQRAFDAAKLHSVIPASAVDQVEPELTEDSIVVELVDGSALRASSYVVSNGRATIELTGGGHVETSTRSIRSVKLRRQDVALSRQWDEIVSGKSSADLIVVRNSTPVTGDQRDQRVSTILDHLEGILQDIDAQVVGFEFDNRRVSVPRAKVEGLVYFHPPGASSPDPACRLTDVSGSQWSVQTLRLGDQGVEIVSCAGVRITLPWLQIAEIDYSAGNMVFLSDLDWESVDFRPYVGLRSKSSSFSQWFQPKRDNGFYGRPLKLGGQQYSKGLALHSRSLVTYRLTRDYHRLLATVGIDDEVGGDGNAEVVILGDGRRLVSRTVTGLDEPFELDLDISGIRRLGVLVDFGEDHSDNGDDLNLCNARLTK